MPNGWTAVSSESLRLLTETLAEYDGLANMCCAEYPSALRATSKKMADLVRELVDDDNDGGEDMASTMPPRRGLTTTAAGLTVYAKCPVMIDSLTYPTAMNAFQAHKAPIGSRDVYTRMSWHDAVSRGRTEMIDRVMWDMNRESLMVTILTEQARQNRWMHDIVMQFAGKRLCEDSMLDKFWPTVLPDVWKAVKGALQDHDEVDGESTDSKKRKVAGMSSASVPATEAATPSMAAVAAIAAPPPAFGGRCGRAAVAAAAGVAAACRRPGSLNSQTS